MLALLDNSLKRRKIDVRIGRFKVLVDVACVQRHASMNCNGIRRPSKNDRNFICSTNDGSDALRIFDPFENLALCVWITAVNFVENDARSAGFFGTALDERSKGDSRHTRPAQTGDVFVRPKRARCINFKRFIFKRSGSSERQRRFSDPCRPGNENCFAACVGKEVGRQQLFRFSMSYNFCKCMRSECFG